MTVIPRHENTAELTYQIKSIGKGAPRPAKRMRTPHAKRIRAGPT